MKPPNKETSKNLPKFSEEFLQIPSVFNSDICFANLNNILQH